MNEIKILLFVSLLLVITVGTATASELIDEVEHADLIELGKLIFFDDDLSVPKGQSCASCHHPEFGFADPDPSRAVSQGAILVRFGNRNSPTAAYAAYSPDFTYDVVEGGVGGQFWDGRAVDLVEQAKGPFLNPLEMNNPSKLAVIVKIRNSDYADLFETVYGAGALDNVETAYNQTAEAIAAFEMTDEVNRFSSKYDAHLKDLEDGGTGILDMQELEGLNLFNNAGKCADCHPSTVDLTYSENPLFTDFTYDNLGVPSNLGTMGDSLELMDYYPFYYRPIAPKFNPDKLNFVDWGLGAIVTIDGEMNLDEIGKMKVPTLRNSAVTPPYMHNGAFTTLGEVVNFYNTRDVDDWPDHEVEANVNEDELGNLGLSEEEEDAIVAFMETLTDGYDEP